MTSEPPRVIPVGQEPPPMDPRPPRRWPAKAEDKPKEKTGKTAGRFGVLNRFVDLTLREIDPTTATVWLVLYRDTKPDGTARTSQVDLARRIGRKVRTVYTALRKLEKLGLLTVVRRGRINAGATVYRVCPTVKGDRF